MNFAFSVQKANDRFNNIEGADHFLIAYFLVHYEAFVSADFLFDFQWSAASLFSGSSGLGSASRL